MIGMFQRQLEQHFAGARTPRQAYSKHINGCTKRRPRFMSRFGHTMAHEDTEGGLPSRGTPHALMSFPTLPNPSISRDPPSRRFGGI